MNEFDMLPKLLRACLDNDRKSVEAFALAIMKRIKKEHPSTAAEISKVLAYSNFEGGYARSLDFSPLPVDKESRSALAKLEQPSLTLDPILNAFVRKQLDDFLLERSLVDKFLAESIVPPNSILLDGAPGVGKTYIAKWLSYKLDLPLVILDLATAISSYLGRTGQNIQSIFAYAKEQPSILFLDELDAIAKKRDDAGDLGELKRLVNVLLKELEDCPSSCVIVGATNHPDLLDRAIWRRFDRAITVPMPDEEERDLLILRHLEKHIESISDDTRGFLNKTTAGVNAADICKLCEHIKRQIVMFPADDINLIVIREILKIVTIQERDARVVLCKKLKSSFPRLTQREISEITQIPLTTISRYLKKEE